MIEELKAIVGSNEKILYEGKPNKKCYVFESIFNPLLPFALIWGIIDFGIIGASFFAKGDGNVLFFIIPFMLLHLMPVWIYLGGILFTAKRYRNNVGDIVATSNQLTANGKSTTIIINSISNYIDIYNLVKKLQTDIYTDVMYPNDKRPTENHGYNTQYKG